MQMLWLHLQDPNLTFYHENSLWHQLKKKLIVVTCLLRRGYCRTQEQTEESLDYNSEVPRINEPFKWDQLEIPKLNYLLAVKSKVQIDDVPFLLSYGPETWNKHWCYASEWSCQTTFFCDNIFWSYTHLTKLWHSANNPNWTILRTKISNSKLIHSL